MIDDSEELDEIGLSLFGKGVTRRDFLKYCGMVAAALGLEASFIPKIAEALEPGLRPPVIWLHFAECTGCTESFLRHPSISDVILQSLSIEYHETLMAPSGANAHKSLADAVSAYSGEFICICEGSIPTARNGIYGMIGNKTMLQIAREVCPKAKAVICYGTCASFGGLAAAQGNVTGAKSVHKALGGFPTVNIPGCPPSPFALVTSITDILLSGFPALDTKGRRSSHFWNIHDHCPYDGGEWGCFGMYYIGCKGPSTTCYHGDPTIDRFCGCDSIMNGLPCSGCSDPNFFTLSNFNNS